MPLFSIVIPTRNRAHLLKFALQSVLRQDCGDYQVIVSDNHSHDDTQQVVAQYADRRVEYVRPDTYLPVHDHWEFARQHARGDYLLILADDDCLVGNALTLFARALEKTGAPIVGCRNAEYFVPNFWVAAQRNTIRLDKFTDALILMDTRMILRECFRFNPVFYPRVSVPIARSLVETIAQRVGRFFDYPFPEYVGYAMFYAMIDVYPLIDRPLVVLGRTPDSLGPRFFWTNRDPGWSETGERRFQFVPLRGTYVTNGIAESFLKAKQNLGERFQGIEISYADYYRGYYTDLLAQRHVGRDVRADQAAYWRAVASLSPELQSQIAPMARDLDRQNQLWRKWARKVKNAPRRIWTLTQKLARAKPSSPAKHNGVVRGKDVGVSDILTCARWIASLEPDR